MDPWGKFGNNRLVRFPVGRETTSEAYLTSQSTKDCALTKKTKVGREIPRVASAVSLSTGAVRASDSHRTNWDGLSMAERRDLAQRVLRARGIENPSKNAIRRMARYGHTLNSGLSANSVVKGI